MIARTWRGWTSAEVADHYLDYLQKTGLEEYTAARGNLGAFVLRRIEAGRAEFLLVSLWRSREDAIAFAGGHANAAVFYPEDELFLVEYDRHVDHFDVLVADVVEPEMPATASEECRAVAIAARSRRGRRPGRT